MIYTDSFHQIKKKCLEGSRKGIQDVLSLLNKDVDLPTTKAIDFFLGMVESEAGKKEIEHFLFHGTQMQRNYCTLYFARRNEWLIVNKAYEMGLIDMKQAYSR